ncbi:MAG: T9SS type A sorting domain-containing protein [Rhodothermaceae bacterium]|nr:T9SS type A sorting domain-containing protein [Rhodothermaceae bacterium]
MALRTLFALMLLAAALPVQAQTALFETDPASRAALTPDQATYLTHLETRETFVASSLVRVNSDALSRQDVLRLDLPQQGAILLQPDRIETRSGRDYSWFGFGEDAASTNGIFVVRDGGITGTVRANHQLYTVRHLGDGLHAVVLLDERQFQDHEEDYTDLVIDAAEEQRAQQRVVATMPIMHLVVAYTAAAVTDLGSAAAVEALIQLAEDETNQGYINSDISARVALAYVYQTATTESSSTSTELTRIYDTSDGYYDELHTHRDTYAADIGIVITGDVFGSSCGRAYVNASSSYAVGVVMQDCATGYYSFGHEIGHLQGMRHNPETDPSTTPYAYGHGKYYEPDVGTWSPSSDNYRTVLSYNCSYYCPRVNWYSNPDISYNGEATGDASERDNARVLDQRAATMAAFRVPSVTVSGDAGWRFMASPVEGLTVAELADQNLIQGISGYYPAASPNFYSGYNGSAWSTPSGGSDVLASGAGFAWYFYDNTVDPGGASESVALPMAIYVTDEEQPFDDVSVALHTSGDKWNLIANPFVGGLDVSGGLGGWATGGSLASGVGQVWDPATGSYSLTSTLGTLASWQGVFVENSSATGIDVPSASRTSGGTFLRQAGSAFIAFELDGTQAGTEAPLLDRAAVLYLHPDAAADWDLYDAAKLYPLDAAYALLAFSGERDGEPMAKAQESQAMASAVRFTVPMSIETAGAETRLALRWPRMEGIPEDWTLMLTDLVTGETVDLRASASHTFTVEAEPAADVPAHPAARPMSPSTATDRFLLTVEAGRTTATQGPADGLPTNFALHAAYPNPFNPSTTVRYEMPHAAPVHAEVFDLLGRRVATLLQDDVEAGTHTMRWDAQDAASGVYILRLQAGDTVLTQRLTLLQ